MLVILDEKIKVGAIFNINGQIKPVWFKFKDTKIFIKSLIYQWKEREGSDTIYKFTATDGVNIYEISYSKNNLEWRLVAMDEK